MIVTTVNLASSSSSYGKYACLGDEGGGGGGLVAPGGRQDTDGLVVTGQTVDTGLDQNQAELGVLVLAVALEVLADRDGLYTGTWLAGHTHTTTHSSNMEEREGTNAMGEELASAPS